MILVDPLPCQWFNDERLEDTSRGISQKFY